VSALDATTQAQIIELLGTVKDEHGVALLFISHNLAVVHELCDRVLVLYLGRMMELAPAQLLYAHPLHPYTRALFEAIPIPDPDIQPARLAHTIPGEPPSALTPPPGCVFQTRCPHVVALCRRQIPRGGGWRRSLRCLPPLARDLKTRRARVGLRDAGQRPGENAILKTDERAVAPLPQLSASGAMKHAIAAAQSSLK